MSLMTVIVVGVIVSAATAFVTREVMQWVVVQPLRLGYESLIEQLRVAQTDVNVVKAIRSGELDAADLAAAGVLDDAEERLGLSAAEEVLAPAEAPRFLPNFYKRQPMVGHLDPGDEVWIDPDDVYHAEDGAPVVWTPGKTSVDEDRSHKVRLRVYTDGSLELGTRPTVVLNGRTPHGLPSRPVARLLNLTTSEIREVTFTTQPATSETSEP